MKFCLHALMLCGALGSFAAEEVVLPTAFPVSRYTEIWENSPFNREVTPPVVQAIQSSFAQTLVLEGLVQDDARGAIAYVRDTKANQPLVITKEPSQGHPYTIVSAHPSHNPEHTKVTITDGKETGEIGFVVASLTQAIAQPVAAAPQKSEGREARDLRNPRAGGLAPPGVQGNAGGGQPDPAAGAAANGAPPPPPDSPKAESQSPMQVLDKMDSEPRRRRIPLPASN